MNLELQYAPLKSHSLTLAERARKLGLEPHAKTLLSDQQVHIHSLCRPDEEELSSVDKICTHITHIVADIIYKDPRVMEHMRKL